MGVHRPTAVAAEVPAEKLQQCQLALMQQLACQHPASREETTSRYSTATEQYMCPDSQTLTLKRSDCVPLAGTRYWSLRLADARMTCQVGSRHTTAGGHCFSKRIKHAHAYARAILSSGIIAWYALKDQDQRDWQQCALARCALPAALPWRWPAVAQPLCPCSQQDLLERVPSAQHVVK